MAMYAPLAVYETHYRALLCHRFRVGDRLSYTPSVRQYGDPNTRKLWWYRAQSDDESGYENVQSSLRSPKGEKTKVAAVL